MQNMILKSQAITDITDHCMIHTEILILILSIEKDTEKGLI